MVAGERPSFASDRQNFASGTAPVSSGGVALGKNVCNGAACP